MIYEISTSIGTFSATWTQLGIFSVSCLFLCVALLIWALR